jgi:PadR family transcriptional regulator, regulatory protein PadR
MPVLQGEPHPGSDDPDRLIGTAAPAHIGAWNLQPRSDVSPLCNLQERRVSDQTDLIQGTLDLLILRTIALEPMHGWAIAQRIQQISDELLRVQQGTLYPALHRLEHQGWITAEWGASDNNRRARFYSLTKAGRQQLTMELSKWERLSAGVNLVLART